MEKNLAFLSDSTKRLRLKLTWAQAEIVPVSGDAFQLLIAGDDESVAELRVEHLGDSLILSQPQLGYAKDIPRRRWLQIGVRIPTDWSGDVELDSVTGTVAMRGLDALGDISISTVSGSITVNELAAGGMLWLHTVSAAIHGTHLRAARANLRTVSGDVSLMDAALAATKLFTISGDMRLHLLDGSNTVDSQSVSGTLCIYTDGPVKAALHSLSGQFLLGDDIPSGQGLEISASSVSGDLAVKRKE